MDDIIATVHLGAGASSAAPSSSGAPISEIFNFSSIDAVEASVASFSLVNDTVMGGKSSSNFVAVKDAASGAMFGRFSGFLNLVSNVKQ